MRCSSFAEAAIGEGAAALNHVFHRYSVPITFSSEQLHLHMSYNDVDAALSPIWYDDTGNFLAAALLAIRGKRAWIGGFGVAPEYRGRGYAKRLLATLIESARERHLQSIALEALCGNEAAIGLYRDGGFQIVRELCSFEFIAENTQMPAGFVFGAPRELVDEPDVLRPCWQREHATLRNGAVSSAVTDNRGDFALFRFNAQLAQVLKIRVQSPQSLCSLAEALAAGREFQSVMLLNEPQESPIAAYAREAGWSEPFLQYEMMLTGF